MLAARIASAARTAVSVARAGSAALRLVKGGSKIVKAVRNISKGGKKLKDASDLLEAGEELGKLAKRETTSRGGGKRQRGSEIKKKIRIDNAHTRRLVIEETLARLKAYHHPMLRR